MQHSRETKAKIKGVLVWCLCGTKRMGGFSLVAFEFRHGPVLDEILLEAVVTLLVLI